MAQKLWFLLNIKKDYEDRAELIKTLCMHIRPEAYFEKESQTVSTDFVGEVEQQLGRPLTEEELAALGAPIEEVTDDDVDIIGKA